NLDRIATQLALAESSLDAGDSDSTFAHAFIPHSTTFPSIKSLVASIDPQQASTLESLLSDLPIKIRTGGQTADELRNDIAAIRQVIDSIGAKSSPQIESDKSMTSQVVVYLLRDSVQSYQLFQTEKQKVDHENAIGLARQAEMRYLDIADMLDERRRLETNSFFKELHSYIQAEVDAGSVARLAGAIERDLAEDLALGQGASANEHQKYFSAIRELLAKVVSDVKSGNYEQADQNAISAYLDNYEYLEAPLEKHDVGLMTMIEIEMREELREMIKSRDAPSEIESHVSGILEKLGSAETLLASDVQSSDPTAAPGSQSGFADIEGLAAGFGTYTGERRVMGDADDPAKAKVRNNIDQIRIKLDQTLLLYEEGKPEEALAASRSAYLDSYENVEIPLRPIDPDFTLEMEIKFAELRNLIQANAPYSEVEGKIIEIRRGLDESERLVSGTGVLAPTIAFSTSFSIIFREGLESALIIGAILTYLE
ncbi:MAG: hypothetical protein ACREA4_08475, partial [Nitrososphaera sp.]